MSGKRHSLHLDSPARTYESYSYDLELDKGLSEETTVLVENYTVCGRKGLPADHIAYVHDVVARWAGNQSRLGALRSTRMSVPTTLDRRRTSRYSRSVLTSLAMHSF